MELEVDEKLKDNTFNDAIEEDKHENLNEGDVP